MDFASDEKAAKRTARRMLEMSRAINGEFLAELPIRDQAEAGQTVSCYTCHRGLARPPRQLVVILGEEARESGSGAALEKYRTLRSEHESAGRYDFREETLTRLARGFAETGDFEPALEILDGAMEIFPGSPSLHTSKGMVELGRGDFEAARVSFEAALSLDPEFESARRGLAHLESMPERSTPEGGD
jgi:tetratricopeptide (TPR) repeat protein